MLGIRRETKNTTPSAHFSSPVITETEDKSLTLIAWYMYFNNKRLGF
jgi:hypothetical protein